MRVEAGLICPVEVVVVAVVMVDCVVASSIAGPIAIAVPVRVASASTEN